MNRSVSSFFARWHRRALASVVVLLSVAACGGNAATPAGGSGGRGGGGTGTTAVFTGDTGGVCILQNCHSDGECGGCSQQRTHCATSTNHCVACTTNAQCKAGQACSASGLCVAKSATCPMSNGAPSVTCSSSADCVACDALHQVCDTTAGKCVACTVEDSTACQATELCDNGSCRSKCPSECSVDNDCASCGAVAPYAHACNSGHCAQCSATYACPAGKSCTPQGTCLVKCGQDGKGACTSDGDCTGCGAGATTCHQPLFSPTGTCGPAAKGCSDFGQNITLPAPWSDVTQLCSHDTDCAGIGINLDVGSVLRDITGISDIKNSVITYPMAVCAAYDIDLGGGTTKSCGVCVPCRVDSDCQNIDIDLVALNAFGPIGAVATAFLLNEVFGPNAHIVNMYCSNIAGDYGVCAPCPDILNACGIFN